MKYILHPTKHKSPDLVEFGLLGVLAIWTLAIIWLLADAITSNNPNSWQALQLIIIAFISITLLVIAIILADMRKEVKDLYT